MTELDAFLHPLPIAGEVVAFDLSAYRSTVTRQMLQLRVRMTPLAFEAGTVPVAATVTEEGARLEVDAAALGATNARVRAGLEEGPEEALACLRRLSGGRATLERVAGAFGARVAGRLLPRRDRFVNYVLASGRYQALGALKFCLPDGLRSRLAGILGDEGLVDDLLAPDGPTLWSTVREREVALARVRLHAPDRYHRRLVLHQREYGYLFAEDVDFRAHETLDAIDSRMAALTADGRAALHAERDRLAEALAAARARKSVARQVLADRLAAERPADVARLLSHVLLARALADHEDRNRRAKMRLLRDLRDLAGLAGLDLERAGLADFAAICPSPSGAATVGARG